MTEPPPTSDPRFAVPVTGTRCGCAECGEVFSCVDAFDIHRAGPMSHRICLDPGEVRRKDGSYMFNQVLWGEVDDPTTKYYWRRRNECVPPEHWDRSKRFAPT
jgi:hypothetical protein